MGVSFTKLMLFFHKFPSLSKHFFTFVWDAACQSLKTSFAEALEFFARTVFQLVIFHKMSSLECIHPGSKKMKVG